MAQTVPAGSDVSAGTYRCGNCGYELSVRSTQSLPPCPSCSASEWRALSGGDAAEDPYPGQRRGRRQSGSSSRGRGGDRTKEQLYGEARRLGIEGRSKMNKQQLAQAVARRQGDGGGGTANPVSVQAFLEGVNYPSRKGDLLREAKTQRASQEVRSTIERLPDRRFGDPTEVSEAIGKLD
jgi:uncharacterized protein DUF2795/zinc ribbon family protein